MQHKEQMAAARGVLQRNVPLLYTASRACLQHPDVAAYKANRELIYKQLQQAVSGISNTAQGVSTEESGLGQHTGPGELAGALNNFDVSIGYRDVCVCVYNCNRCVYNVWKNVAFCGAGVCVGGRVHTHTHPYTQTHQAA